MRVFNRGSLAAAAALAVLPWAAPASAAVLLPCPRVVAHRAGANYAPEDTTPGVSMAAGQGATVVEMDIRWSANANTQSNPGYPVLMHDATVDRTTNGTGPVDKLGLTQLLALHANDYPPWKTDPRFASTPPSWAGEFLKAASTYHLDLLFDVKVTPGLYNARKLIEYVDRYGYRPHITYMGNPGNVQTMHGWYPDLAYTIIEYPPAGMIRTGESVRAAGAGGYAVPWDRITPAAVTYWHSYGLDVGTWTSDNAAYETTSNWAALTAAGVDSITTNEPARLATWEATGCVS